MNRGRSSPAGGGAEEAEAVVERDKGTKERAGQVASASHSELLTVTGTPPLGVWGL